MLKMMRRVLRYTRSLIVVSVVVIALGFNLLTMTFAPLAGAMLNMASRLGLDAALAAMSELDRLQADNENHRNELQQAKAELEIEREKTKKTKTRVKTLTADNITRSKNKATRNIASMSLESLPVVGVLTIVSVTALELYNACQTARDMNELRQLFGLDAQDTTLIEELCTSTSTGPGPDDWRLCREHAQKVRTDVGPEAADPIEKRCDCLELPDGCPGPFSVRVEPKPSPPER